MTDINTIVPLVIAFFLFLLLFELIWRLFINRIENANKPSLEESKDDLILHDVKGDRQIITIFESVNRGNYELKYVIPIRSINHIEAKNNTTYIWLNENTVRFIMIHMPLPALLEKLNCFQEIFHDK